MLCLDAPLVSRKRIRPTTPWRGGDTFPRASGHSGATIQPMWWILGGVVAALLLLRLGLAIYDWLFREWDVFP